MVSGKLLWKNDDFEIFLDEKKLNRGKDRFRFKINQRGERGDKKCLISRTLSSKNDFQVEFEER